MALLVLDASVVIAFLDERNALHERAAEGLASALSAELVIPASAYAEVLVGAYKLDPRRVAALEDALTRIPIRVEPITADIARAAARLRAGHDSLRLADAIVLATAGEIGASVLTGDRALGRHAGVRVI